ncbi:hypothetical protein JAAARDRAFT_175381 [Jaapia argillacea MUCL 33604]|uniref:G domain-containing protein n=1 Tax=Jaapia argillacea MUCL 33604 TaxID=933084 RepID=A0A067QB72_9AGAM|nr:hypothetical protein JAAARDRAFT_175381 [Jaapia argillacea MUCL 33604]
MTSDPPPRSSSTGKTVDLIRSTTPSSSGIPTANVIVFGETGVGKSSVINMVTCVNVASTSGGARGCTFGSGRYIVHTPHVTLNLFDTPGLDQSQEPATYAGVVRLVRSMKDGVNLLVYVIRGPRLWDLESMVKHYRVLFEVICQQMVPIVVVVTGLEWEEPCDGWWCKNRYAFDHHDMMFSGHACITAIRGKFNKRANRYVLEDEYNESVVKVMDVIKTHYSTRPFKMERASGFLAVLKTTFGGAAEQVFGPEVREPRSR